MSDLPLAARLYPETVQLQVEMEELFGAAGAVAVRRESAARELRAGAFR